MSEVKTLKQIYSLRVNQIDSKSLDNELNALFESKFNEIKSKKFRQLSPELLALVKTYIWFYSTRRNGISIGHSLLELKYYDLSHKKQIKDNLNAFQNISILLTQILFPLFNQRINCFVKNQKIINSFEIFENIYKTLDLINSLIFLYYGKYRSLWERMLRIGTGVQSIPQTPTNSELYSEIMTRELLWHTFSEFLTFVLPLINFYRLKNTFVYWIQKYVFPSSVSIESNVKLRDLSDLKSCVVCNEWPVLGHEIGCRHVFCYYCLMSNFMADPTNGFTCGQCFYNIKSIQCIKSVKIMTF